MVNYVRCHDDSGWTFSDESAAKLNIHGNDHRRFLNNFYTGRFEGSFAHGLPFQENPKTGDMRISGTCASLAGLEKALREETATEVDLAIRRILLIHAIVLTIGGIPLIYLGDEVGTLNDYSFREDSAKAADSRWVHRPVTDWDKLSLRNNPGSVEGSIFQGLRRLIEVRQQHTVFGKASTEIIEADNDAILAFTRLTDEERMLVFANFSEGKQTIPANLLRIYGLSYTYRELISGRQVDFEDIVLEPYGFICLKAE